MAEVEFSDHRTAHPETRHEGSDVSLRWILGSAIGLTIGAIISLLVLWWIFVAYLRAPSPGSRPISVLAERERSKFPPEPQIEGLQPAYDIPKYEVAEEARKLNRYGWVNRDEKIVRMPVEEAMVIVAEQLPSRPTEDPGRPGKAWDLPDDANSGRMLGVERP